VKFENFFYYTINLNVDMHLHADMRNENKNYAMLKYVWSAFVYILEKTERF